PASRSAFEQASSVAPVVITSSSSKTRRLSTWLPGGSSKAPRTTAQRSRSVNTSLCGRRFVRRQQNARVRQVQHFLALRSRVQSHFVNREAAGALKTRKFQADKRSISAFRHEVARNIRQRKPTGSADLLRDSGKSHPGNSCRWDSRGMIEQRRYSWPFSAFS